MIEDRQHFLWTEKYRPSTFENYIGNEGLKVKMERYIAEQDIPHLLLTGPAGTGKTTAAKILVNQIDCDSMIINASDENNIETVRSKIKGFAATRGFKPLKIMVLDECDYLTLNSQAALRNLMEQFSKNTRFILTANYIEKVIDPIISRTQHFKVVPPSKKDVALHVAHILKTEGVSFKPADVKFLIDAHFPDIRKVLGELQLATRDGTVVIDVQNVVESDFKLKIVSILTNNQLKKKEKFISIRQMIADADIRDFTDLYRLLYDKVVDITPTSVSAGILAIAEGQYQDALVVDKEICFMAMIVKLLEVI